MSIHTNMYNTYHFSIHTNTNEYVQIHVIHTIHTNVYQCTSVLPNTYQYRHIQINTYWYIQYISSLLTKHTNIDQDIPYMPIHTNTSNTDQFRSKNTSTYLYIVICTIHTYAYQFRSVLSKTYQYRHIQINTYQYV